MNFIGGLSNEFYWRLVQMIYIEGLYNGFSIRGSSNGFQKKKSFILKTISYMANACVRESVRTRDMGHGI